MKSFPSPAAGRVALGLTAILLAGCTSARNTADISVNSPPPPPVGSGPITAYDDFARAFAPAKKVPAGTVAQAGPP